MSTDPPENNSAPDPSYLDGHLDGHMDSKSSGESESEREPQRDAVESALDKSQKVFRDYNRYSSVGIQFGAFLALFIFGGYWLDQKFGTSPWLLITGVLVGFGGGLASLLHKFPISKRRKASRLDPPDHL